jgi:hypothetical protein
MKITPQFSGVNRPLSVELALIFIAPGVASVRLSNSGLLRSGRNHANSIEQFRR